MSEVLEIVVVKSEGMMMFDLLSILECDGFGVWVRVLAPRIVLTFAGLVFTVLLLFGCGLLDPLCVLIGVASIRVLPEDFFF